MAINKLRPQIPHKNVPEKSSYQTIFFPFTKFHIPHSKSYSVPPLFQAIVLACRCRYAVNQRAARKRCSSALFTVVRRPVSRITGALPLHRVLQCWVLHGATSVRAFHNEANVTLTVSLQLHQWLCTVRVNWRTPCNYTVTRFWNLYWNSVQGIFIGLQS
jgi:hypothetical protein